MVWQSYFLKQPYSYATSNYASGHFFFVLLKFMFKKHIDILTWESNKKSAFNYAPNLDVSN